MIATGGKPKYMRYRCALWKTYNCKGWIWANGARCLICTASGRINFPVSGFDSTNPMNLWVPPGQTLENLMAAINRNHIELPVRESIESTEDPFPDLKPEDVKQEYDKSEPMKLDDVPEVKLTDVEEWDLYGTKKTKQRK